MRRFGLLLMPMIIVGVLVLSGCAKGDGPAVPPFALSSQTKESVKQFSTSASTLGSSFKQPEIPSGKSTVYIYRPAGSGMGGMALPFGVKANAKVITTLTKGGYYAYVAEPGNVQFSAFEIGFMAPTDTSSINVDAKAGQACYLKGSHGKGMGGRANLAPVSPEVGANEITGCKIITQ